MTGSSMTHQNKTAKETGEQTPVKTSLGRRLTPLILIVALMAIAFSQGWHKYLSLEQLALNLGELRSFLSANYLTAVFIYIGLYIAVAALSIPVGSVLTISGGLLFGWFIGTIATIVGATIGATILFLVAKTSLGETLAAKAGPWLKDLRAGFAENAMSYMFFLRLVPGFPFWLVNIAPSLLGVNLRTYVIATFFGIIPGSLAYSYLGAGFESVITAQQTAYQNCINEKGNDAGCSLSLDASSLITNEIVIAFVLLSLVALIPVFVKRLRRTNKTS